MQIQYSISIEALSKGRFEHGLQDVFEGAALLAPAGKRGHDIDIKGQKFSLKS